MQAIAKASSFSIGSVISKIFVMKNLLVILPTILFLSACAPKKMDRNQNNVAGLDKSVTYNDQSVNSSSTSASRYVIKSDVLPVDCRNTQCGSNSIAISGGLAKDSLERGPEASFVRGVDPVPGERVIIRSHKDLVRDINDRHNQIHDAVLKAEKKKRSGQ